MENEVRDLSRKILDKGSFISLATHDDGGVWVSGLLYVLDSEYNIYWKSDDAVRHSQAILNNPNVAGTVIITAKPGETSEAVQIAGTAERITEVPEEVRRNYLVKRNKTSESDTTHPDTTWYKLIPQKVRLSYSPRFGYDKQDAEL